MGRATALAIVSLLVFAGTAQALEPRLQIAADRAETYYPEVATICPGGVDIIVGGLEDAARHGAEAWRPCQIRFNPIWPDYGRAHLCSLMIHEYGHLAGHDHSADPTNVMYPSAAIETVPACVLIREQEERLMRVTNAISHWRMERPWRNRKGRARVDRKIRHLKGIRSRLLVALGP